MVKYFYRNQLAQVAENEQLNDDCKNRQKNCNFVFLKWVERIRGNPVVNPLMTSSFRTKNRGDKGKKGSVFDSDGRRKRLGAKGRLGEWGRWRGGGEGGGK